MDKSKCWGVEFRVVKMRFSLFGDHSVIKYGGHEVNALDVLQIFLQNP